MSAPIDPNYDMPFPDYQQTGSFIGPVSLPALGPLEGTLVSLPCLNPDWLRLLLGCVDQLRNPSTWASLTPSQTVTALGQVEDLRGALQQGGTCVICPEMRLEGCVLQFSCDAGATWTDVAGWAENFASCVVAAFPCPPITNLQFDTGCDLKFSTDCGGGYLSVPGWTDNFSPCVSGVTIPPVPPNPGSDTTAQRACNIANYIASVMIKDVLTNAVTAFNSSLSTLEFGLLIFDTVAFAFPITAIAADIFAALYIEITSINISDFTAAQTDPLLQSQLTCAIYEAISGDGYIKASNLSAVITNVCAMVYTYPSVVTALCTFITGIGLQNLQAMQNVGALDVADCSGCTPEWCYHFDFTSSDGGWTPNFGHYTPGVGFQSDPDIPDNGDRLTIALTVSTAATIDTVEIFGSAAGTASDPHQRSITNSGAWYKFYTQAAGAIDATVTVLEFTNTLQIAMFNVPLAGTNTITALTIHGRGPTIYGTPNC
jgi:hypothetical protein